jgi:hypothetical protein
MTVMAIILVLVIIALIRPGTKCSLGKAGECGCGRGLVVDRRRRLFDTRVDESDDLATAGVGALDDSSLCWRGCRLLWVAGGGGVVAVGDSIACDRLFLEPPGVDKLDSDIVLLADARELGRDAGKTQAELLGDLFRVDLVRKAQEPLSGHLQKRKKEHVWHIGLRTASKTKFVLCWMTGARGWR